MHAQIFSELAAQSRNIDSILEVASAMPDDLPRAWFVSANATPSIHFRSPDQSHVNPVVNHFGRGGWTPRATFSGTEYFKALPNGVEIVIENAVPRYQAPVNFPDAPQTQN